ncbi:hypothetical protein FFF34_005980 [Inquilinus sp. KBS0705]|nr:hypothetical protein FFF34_005980 [Inquilinus sp. KBS0705]
MGNLRTLIWYFYKPILLWNLAFTLICVGLIAFYGTKVNSFVFFFKLMGYASTTFLQSYTAKNVYMYYRNAGYSIRKMYAYTYLIDFCIYVILLTAYLATKA